MGKRVKRGLFQSNRGIKYNADLNGALNILRKVAGNSIFDGKLVKRLVVSPLRFTPYKAWVDFSTKLVTIRLLLIPRSYWLLATSFFLLSTFNFYLLKQWILKMVLWAQWVILPSSA